jgi:hypothetical protein
MLKANELLTVNDKDGWSCDVERRQSKAVIDAVTPDH